MRIQVLILRRIIQMTIRTSLLQILPLLGPYMFGFHRVPHMWLNAGQRGAVSSFPKNRKCGDLASWLGLLPGCPTGTGTPSFA